MAKKPKQKKHPEPQNIQLSPFFNLYTKYIRYEKTIAAVFYSFLTVVVTFPLLFRLRSSVYGSYDHASTDLFGSIYLYFWWPLYALSHGHFPTDQFLIAAPFGAVHPLFNLTGFFALPVTAVLGPVASMNIQVMLNLILSGFFTFLLVRHLTKNSMAALLAGIIFGFCPNMLIRSYTTFDATQVQWIVLYIYFLILFTENPSWKNILGAAISLILISVASMPYYLVFIPFLTALFVIAWLVRHLRTGGSLQSLASKHALHVYLKIAAGGLCVLFVFGVFYKTFAGVGGEAAGVKRGEIMIEELKLRPLDYLMPTHRQTIFRNAIRSYWVKRNALCETEGIPPLNWDSAASYLGIIVIVFAILGITKRRDWIFWFFAALGIFAFLATLGARFIGIPGPALIINAVAPFARRMLLYNIIVQLSLAVTAAFGFTSLFGKIKDPKKCIWIFTGLVIALMVEYTIIPPVHSSLIGKNPAVYEWVRDIDEDVIVMEYPQKRMQGYIYQGYQYYQSIHKKRLFNSYTLGTNIPEKFQLFYEDMQVPAALADMNNRRMLSYFGVKYIIAHKQFASKTVIFRSLPKPDVSKLTDLKLVFKSPDTHENFGPYPTDYILADVYEVTVKPATVLITWDMQNPYLPLSGEYRDEGKGFYFSPFWLGVGNWRFMLNDGTVTLMNLLDKDNVFDLHFNIKTPGQKKHTVQALTDGHKVAEFTAGIDPQNIVIKDIVIPANGSRKLVFHDVEGPDTFTLKKPPISFKVSVMFNNFEVREHNTD